VDCGPAKLAAFRNPLARFWHSWREENSVATIRNKGPEQWHAQVRRAGWPVATRTLRTRKEAETWARDVESQMDRGIFVDRSESEASRASEKSRLERFMRDEPKLCAYANMVSF
jgi:hypothetical protein